MKRLEKALEHEVELKRMDRLANDNMNEVFNALSQNLSLFHRPTRNSEWRNVEGKDEKHSKFFRESVERWRTELM